MGTIEPPPGPISGSGGADENPRRTLWDHPILLLVAVGVVAWGAYVAGHRNSGLATTPKPAAADDTGRAVSLPAPTAAAPTSAATSAPPLRVTTSAAPAASPAYVQERRGAATTVDAKPTASPDGTASLQAMQAEEKLWRDRAPAVRARLAKAQDDYNRISDANPLIQLRDGGISAAALGARNAALSP
ncbi:MAG TPA: hypothetical protein VF579_12435, partial [Candidatus Methylomirabilis sp.]